MFVCTLSPPGFNPVWEETLSFTLHMAEVVLVRFLVWDHDPIGRDFIGQRTVAFSSLMPGKCSFNIYCLFYCFFLLQQYCTNVDLWLMCFPYFRNRLQTRLPGRTDWGFHFCACVSAWRVWKGKIHIVLFLFSYISINSQVCTPGVNSKTRYTPQILCPSSGAL